MALSKTAIALISSSAVIVIVLIILAALGFFTPSVDCEVSEWGPCNPVTGKRTRTVIKQKQGRGKDCPVLEEDCPVNCVMSTWGPCVGDKQTRTVTTPAKNGGTACGSLEQSCVVPFSAGSTLSTDPQDYASVRYLDRHPPICPGKPINGFKLSINPSTNKAQIDYKCGDNLDAGEKVSKSSALVTGSTTVDLSVAPVTCDANQVLSNYGLKSDNGYQFKYDCIKSNKNLSCRELSTVPNADITSHNVQCNNDEVISSVKVKDNGNNLVSYIYTCCKKALPAL